MAVEDNSRAINDRRHTPSHFEIGQPRSSCSRHCLADLPNFNLWKRIITDLNAADEGSPATSPPPSAPTSPPVEEPSSDSYQAGGAPSAPSSDLRNIVRRKLTGYVGFANLPNQWHRKSVRKGFNFNVMVVGMLFYRLLP